MANAVIGALRVNLGLDSANFRNGLKKSRSRLAAFARAAKLAFVAAAAATAVALGAMARASLGFIDNQAKTARSVDGTIDGLRALQLAASDAGIAEEQLNKSSQMLSARLVEAQVKGGATADALERLGLRAGELQKLDVDERFAVIADRMKELGYTSSQASQFLMDMGVRSKEMANLLTQGGDAIRAARGEIAALGLSLNAVDAAKVEAANDAMSRIKLASEALGNRIAIAVAPALEGMANAFTRSMREGGLLRTVIDGIARYIEVLTRHIGNVVYIGQEFVSWMREAGDTSPVFSSIASALGDVVGKVMGAFAGVVRLVAGFANLIRGAGGFGEAMKLLADVAVEAWQRIGKGMDFIRASMAAVANKMVSYFYMALGKIAGKFQEFTWMIADFMTSIGVPMSGLKSKITLELNGAFKDANAAATAAAASAAKAKEAFAAPFKSIEKLRSTVKKGAKEATAAINETAGAADGLTASLDAAGGAGGGKGGKSGGGGAKSLEKVADAAKKAREKLRPLEDAARGFFTATASGAKSLGEAFRELLGKLRDLALNNLFDHIWSGVISRVVGGRSGQGLFGGLLGRAFKIPGFANGTKNAPGGLAWVGERGRELVNLAPGTQVIPHAQSERLMRGDNMRGRLEIGLSPDLEARWMGQSMEAAGVLVRQSARAQQANLAGAVSEMQRRGTSR